MVVMKVLLRTCPVQRWWRHPYNAWNCGWIASYSALLSFFVSISKFLACSITCICVKSLLLLCYFKTKKNLLYKFMHCEEFYKSKRSQVGCMEILPFLIPQVWSIKNTYTGLNDEGTVFNFDKIFKSNVSALNGAFFKVPGWLNIHSGFIIANQLKKHPCKYKYEHAYSLHLAIPNWKCHSTWTYKL